MKGFDLEGLKDALRDDLLWIACGIVKRIEYAKDRSVARVVVNILPEDRPIIARMTWEGVGPNAGIFMPIQIDDLVLVGAADGEEDTSFILKRLTSRVDLIPQQVVDGNMVVRSLDTQSLYLGSKLKTLIGRIIAGADPDEPLVLGKVEKQLWVDVLTSLSTFIGLVAAHTHTGNMGAATSAPGNATAMTTEKGKIDTQKASPVQDDLLVSDVVFTEKGV